MRLSTISVDATFVGDRVMLESKYTPAPTPVMNAAATRALVKLLPRPGSLLGGGGGGPLGGGGPGLFILGGGMFGAGGVLYAPELRHGSR